MLRSLASIPRTAVRGFSVTSSSLAEAERTRTQPPSNKEVDELFADKPKGERQHAYSRNRVEIVGGVTMDPVLRTAKNNRAFTILQVATNQTTKLPNGETKSLTEYHPISIFGPLAETVVNTIKKGNRVLIEGRLHHTGGAIDANGERSPRQIHIVASSVQPFARFNNPK